LALPICTGAERLKTAAGDKLHPTQKPEALLHRVLVASSKRGDLVLDPFFGVGTTGAVAKRLGRRFIGIEREPEYARLAEARIRAVRPADEDAIEVTLAKRQEPRIPFGWLVERGMLEPGETLYDPQRRHAARVRADGTLAARDVTGSIHQVGAALQGLPACNGWSFWCFERKGQLLPIEMLRQKLRAELN
jgi:modification methylase